MRTIFFLLVLALTACRSNEVPEGVERVVYEGPNLKSFMEVLGEIEVVRLQEADSILVDDHASLLQRDSSLYLIDRVGQGDKGIFRFALDGRFLGKIGNRGNAPEEYPNPMDVLVGEEADEVTVVSEPYLTMTSYTKEGVYQGRRQTDIPIAGVWKFPTSYWVVSGFGDEHKPPYLLRLDTALSVTDTVFLPVNPYFKRAMPLSMFMPHDRGAVFYQFVSPLLYEVTADAVRPFLFFDFGKDYSTYDEIVRNDTRKVDKGTYALVAHYWESRDHLLLVAGTSKDKKTEKMCYGLKNRVSGQWDWLEVTQESQLEWWMRGVSGFANDGRMMFFFFGNELENFPADARKLVKNPEELDRIDPDVDMFVLLCRLK